MQKRAYFKANWLAYLFIAPQLLIIFVFFYWPASQAMYWAFTLEQPFGGGNQWVGLDNFKLYAAPAINLFEERCSRVRP